MNEFRELKASEIDVRIQSINDKNGNVIAILLLYKDARCDMNILDETVGPTGWQRTHKLIGDRLYCEVSIYDPEKKQWISKEDVGTESNTEAEKGHASDSFKRSCVNWGIGRELYTAPNIVVPLNSNEFWNDKGKLKSNAKFFVQSIEYCDRKISSLVICDKAGNVRYSYPYTVKKEESNQVNAQEQHKTKKQMSKSELLMVVGKLKMDAKACGIDFDDPKVIECIKKYNNGKIDQFEMSDSELYNFAQVIQTLINRKQNEKQ